MLDYNDSPFTVFRKISELPISDIADYELIVNWETITGGFKYILRMFKPRSDDVIIRSGISLVNVSLPTDATIVQPTSTEANPSPLP